MGTPAHYIPPVRYPDYHQAVLDRTEAWLRRFAAATTNQNREQNFSRLPMGRANTTVQSSILSSA